MTDTMGWIGKFIFGILALGFMAILADVVTWMYEIAWVIPTLLIILMTNPLVVGSTLSGSTENAKRRYSDFYK